MGRMVQRGYPSPEATIITSLQRDYTVLEKMPMGGAVADSEQLEAVGRQFAKQFVAIDTARLIQEKKLNPLSGNALLLGALAASKALPIEPEHYRQAITRMGLATEMNLKAFEVGFEHVRSGGHEAAKRALSEEADPIEQRVQKLPTKFQDGYRRLVAPLSERYGETIARTLTEAVYQLIDYQDLSHAEEYLRRVAAVYEKDRAVAPDRPDATVTHTFARNLATLMTYEDAIRVAEFKTRQERVDQIKARLGVQSEEGYEIIDYLKPDAQEVYGIFPWWMVTPLLPVLKRLRITHDAKGHERYWPQTPRTTTFAGYMTLRFLTLFKPLRPQSWRARKERAFQAEYEKWVHRFLDIDYELAVQVAGLGQLVRGYGQVRRRTIEAAHYLITSVLTPLVERERKARNGYRLTRRVGEVAHQTILADENGLDLVKTLIDRVLEKYETMPYDALIDEVTRAGETLRQPLAISMREIAIL